MELYPTPDVVHRELNLIAHAFTAGREYPQIVALGVKLGVPYKQPYTGLYDASKKENISPVAVMTLARERVTQLAKLPDQQLRVVLVAFEDHRHAPDRSFNVVIDGIPGYDMERRWCAATILPPMYVFGKHATPQNPRLGTWTELYNPAPVLFPELPEVNSSRG